MMVTKRSLLWFLVGIESCVFLITYLVGSHGIQKTRLLKKELVQVQEQKHTVQAEIDDLAKTIHQWQTNDFYVEKLAREQLQMARPTEQLYVITHQTQEEQNTMLRKDDSV